MPAEPPVDPPPDDDELAPPQFCAGCGLPLDTPDGCTCERIEVTVLIRLEDTTS